MAKIKERKSESWKPGIHHDDGFISKNKKRKEKRMSLNLSAKKIDTEEFIPIKKSSFLPFNKGKKNFDEGFKQTPNKFLSPALNKQKQTPQKKDNNSELTPKGKKENSFVTTPSAKKFSIGNPSKVNNTPNKNTGSPKKLNDTASKSVNVKKANTPNKNVDTPKKLNVISKSAIKKKAEEFIDSEAEEGEEPITDKEVKPYVKGENKRKKSISFKFENDEESDSESEDDDDEYGSFDDSDKDSDEDSDDEVTHASDYLDAEASEGEETDDEDDEDDEDDDDEDDSTDDFKDFMIKDNDEESDDDEDESDEDDSSDEDDEEDVKPQIKTNNSGSKLEKKNIPIANGNKNSKIDKKIKEEKEPKEKKKIKEEKEPAVKKVKVEKQPAEGKSKAEKQVVEKKLKSDKKSADVTPINETPVATSKFVGFVRELPKTVTDEQIKSQLATAIGAKNIVSVVLKKSSNKKNANYLIYVSDEDSLEKLLNKQFTIGANKFKVYKARENPKPTKDKPVAFLPRVPLNVSDEKIKAAIEADIGPGKIIDFKSKKIAEKFQTRNILITVSDEETLKKMIYKGGYVCGGVEVIVRQAYESGFKVPIYKVVFSDIPENTTETALKKAIESSLGKGNVIHVKFSFRKNSFAFVTLKTEEAQKKALEVGNDISIKNSKLKVLEYRPRQPRKRGPIKKKDAPDAKKQKTADESQTAVNASPDVKKAKKQKSKTPQNAQNGKPTAKVNQQNSSNVDQPNVQNSPQKNKSRKNKKSKNAPAATPEKKANLSEKIEAKRNKLKEKKFKKKQKASDD